MILKDIADELNIDISTLVELKWKICSIAMGNF